MIQEFVNYFDNLLRQDAHVNPISSYIINQGHVLSNDDRIFLYAPFDDEAIKEALFHIGDEKAHGPNGFTSTSSKTTGTQSNMILWQPCMNSSKMGGYLNNSTM